MRGPTLWSDSGASAHPIRRLGGAAPGRLMLPDASPTPGTMYAPRGVWTDGSKVVVCDTGNHRVLIWHTWPDHDGAPADVVLGQRDFTTEGPQAAGTETHRGLHLPTSACVIDGRLVVADAWNHRILGWEGIPTESFATPTYLLGQPDLDSVLPNQGGDPGLGTFYWPFNMGVVADVFWVTDTGNRRVLGWRGSTLPEPGRPADILLGQDDAAQRGDNRGEGVGAMSFRWPHAVAGDERTLYIADAGDHRVLGWTPPPLDGEREADIVLGQQDLLAFDEFKNRPQGAQRMRFPYAIASDSRRIVVGDTSNNRILLWHTWPREGAGVPADTVLGQPDMDANGENRWQAVEDDSLCWPYGVCLAGDRLAIADSGNNRVMFWELA